MTTCRPRCASCSSDKERGKLISCLHTLCTDCLERSIDTDGSVKCPTCGGITAPKTGQSLIPGLPKSYPEPSFDPYQGSTTTSNDNVCDDCPEDSDTQAVSFCEACDIKLCKEHADSHPRARRTRTHEVIPLDQKSSKTSADGGKAGSEQRCSLHHGHALVKYCMTCCELLCALCMDRGQHTEHKDAVLSIEEAAKKVRKAVDEKAQAFSTGSGEVVSKSASKVKTAVDDVATQADQASGDIATFFEAARKAIDQREQELMSRLDKLCKAKLLPLESQQKRLQQQLERGKSAGGILSSCEDDVDVLRMWQWLEAAVSDHSEEERCTSAQLVFSADDVSQLIERIQLYGVVLDLSEGEWLKFPDEVLGGDRGMAITLADDSALAQQLSPQERLQIAVEVKITDPDDKVVHSSAEKCDSSGEVLAKYKPVVPGEHRVTAMISNKHVFGSPALIRVRSIEAPKVNFSFDACSCHDYVEISDDGTAARHTSDDGYHSVCTNSIVNKFGQTSIRFKVDYPRGHPYIYLCVSSLASPELGKEPGSKEGIYGWLGMRRTGPCKCEGAQLGQPWKKGDVITLTLDLEQLTLTGLHERSKKTEELKLPHSNGPMCFFVSMADPDAKVSILH